MSGKPMSNDRTPTPGQEERAESSDVREPEWALSPAFRAELDRRLEAHRLNPDAAQTWEEVEAEIQQYLATLKATAA